MNQMPMDPVVITIYEQFKDYTQGKKITATNIIQLVTMIMSTTQNTVNEHGKGSYKKTVVLTVIRRLIADSDLDKDDKITLDFMAQHTVPPTIDTLISVARGDIDIKKKINKCCTIS